MSLFPLICLCFLAGGGLAHVVEKHDVADDDLHVYQRADATIAERWATGHL